MPEWNGIIAIEGQPTGDGRMLENGSLRWEDGPWPVLWDREEGDHTAMVVGSMTRIWRDTNGSGPVLIRAEGDWSATDDLETVAAINRVTELLEEGAVGVSIALDDETIELRIAPDLLPDDEDEALVASLIGDAGLPVADANRPWSAAAARNRVFSQFTDDDGVVDVDQVSRAFLWRDTDADPTTQAAYKLGFADVVNGRLTIVPKGAAFAASARGIDGLSGVSDDQRNRLRGRLCRIYDRIREQVSDWSECPFSVEMETVFRVDVNDFIQVVTSGRVRHLAIVDTPAFADARIGLVAVGSLLAASSKPPFTPPGDAASVFSDPTFGKDGHTDPRLIRQEAERPGESVTWGAPLTVTEDGRVFGHAALWGRCHAGFRDRCVIPPRNGDYSRFLHGEAEPGIRTGPLTVGTTHARMQASAVEAMDHYSHTGRAAADVVVGEDQFGLWVSGRLRPGLSDRDLADLRGSSLSGDWRPVNGRYRLAGLLAVNQPGYLVQRSTPDMVITAGPCACDDSDPVSLLAERVMQLETLVAELHRPVLVPGTVGSGTS